MTVTSFEGKTPRLGDEFKSPWLGFKQTCVDLCERYREGYGNGNEA